LVRRLLIVAFVIGAILVIVGTVSALTFDPFPDDVLPPITTNGDSEKVFTNIRIECPEGFGEGFDPELGQICFNDDPFGSPLVLLNCGENVRNDMVFIVLCETVTTDFDDCTIGDFVNEDEIFYSCPNNIYIIEDRFAFESFDCLFVGGFPNQLMLLHNHNVCLAVSEQDIFQ